MGAKMSDKNELLLAPGEDRYSQADEVCNLAGDEYYVDDERVQEQRRIGYDLAIADVLTMADDPRWSWSPEVVALASAIEARRLG